MIWSLAPLCPTLILSTDTLTIVYQGGAVLLACSMQSGSWIVSRYGRRVIPVGEMKGCTVSGGRELETIISTNR